MRKRKAVEPWNIWIRIEQIEEKFRSQILLRISNSQTQQGSENTNSYLAEDTVKTSSLASNRFR